jgi:hypothetical protein
MSLPPSINDADTKIMPRTQLYIATLNMPFAVTQVTATAPTINAQFKPLNAAAILRNCYTTVYSSSIYVVVPWGHGQPDPLPPLLVSPADGAEY